MLYVLPFHFGGKYNIFKLKEVQIKLEIIVVKFTADYRAMKISIQMCCNHFFLWIFFMITCVAYNLRFNEQQLAVDLKSTSCSDNFYESLKRYFLCCL